MTLLLQPVLCRSCDGADSAATSGRNFLSSNLAVFEGFGVDFTLECWSGLNFNDGTGDAGAVTTLDNAQTITAGGDPLTPLNVTLTVDSLGAYAYSINGAAASTDQLWI